MPRSARIRLAVGGVLLVLNVLLAALPKDWLERLFGFEPDGGNGLLELGLLLIPFIVGLALVAQVLVSSRRAAQPADPLSD
jgi:hypothetical protein